MRRSAAPSLKSSAKRLRFLSSLIDHESEIDKENELLEYLEPEIAHEFNSLTSKEPEIMNNVSIITPEETTKTGLRSTSEVLQLILGASSEEPKFSEPKEESIVKPKVINKGLDTASCSLKPSDIYLQQSKPKLKDVVHVKKDYDLPKTETSVSHFNVLWCKRSMKKHKIWEGDGILIVRERSAILKDSEGKVIDRGIGYKLKDVSSLEEGSKFFIGGKECEIQNLIPSEDYVDVKNDKDSGDKLENSSIPLSVFKSSKRMKPCM